MNDASVKSSDLIGMTLHAHDGEYIEMFSERGSIIVKEFGFWKISLLNIICKGGFYENGFN